MFEDNLATFLCTTPGLVALQADRVYPEVLPQSPTLPATVYHEISDVPTYSHSGDSGLDEAVYQFSCWGNTPREAKLLANALRAVLGSNVHWQAAFVENRFARGVDHQRCGLLSQQVHPERIPELVSDCREVVGEIRGRCRAVGDAVRGLPVR